MFLIENLDKIPTRAPELTTEPTKHKNSKIKLQQEFLNAIIAEEIVISYEIMDILELF